MKKKIFSKTFVQNTKNTHVHACMKEDQNSSSNDHPYLNGNINVVKKYLENIWMPSKTDVQNDLKNANALIDRFFNQ